MSTDDDRTSLTEEQRLDEVESGMVGDPLPLPPRAPAKSGRSTAEILDELRGDH